MMIQDRDCGDENDARFVQLATPLGPIYVDPRCVTCIGYSHVEEYGTKQTEPVRMVNLPYNSYYVFDTADNMEKLLK